LTHLPNLGVTDEVATHSSFSVTVRHGWCFVFMKATENPVSNKYVVTKGT